MNVRRAAIVASALVLGACSRQALPPLPQVIEPPPVEIETVVLPGDESVLLDEIGVSLDARLAAYRADAELAALGLPAGVNPADFDIPIRYNADVQYWIDYFTGRERDRFELYLIRQGRYEEMIRSRLRERGMPEDLIYLALIESGFSPRAVSSASAVGIWQFIAATGRRYGLEISAFVDERRDPLKATDAALDYLSELYDQFGSWYLAAAAYNSGENRVERVLRERAGGARGDDDLFWKIQPYLPPETRNYVPLMIAAGILSKYRERYGFSVVPESPEAYDVVVVPDATDLDVIAEAAGVTRAEIDALNPQFLRGMTPLRREAKVRVPAGRGEAFAAAYAQIPPEERIRIVEHTVRRGETLSAIAAMYGSTVSEIQSANNIRNPNSIRVGQYLVIPRAGATSRGRTLAASTSTSSSSSSSASGSSASGASASSDGSGTIVYRVRPGDSLWSIANRNGVTVADLQAWNNLGNRSTIRPGQQLVIRPAAGAVRTHRVQPGDTLWAIARLHGVTTRDLMEWNGLSPNAVIRPGDQIRVHVGR